MNWVVANHTWLFDGFGGALVIALIGWVWTAFKKDPPAAVIENSKVTNAPVAAGSDNNQNVNAPVFNNIVHLPPQTAAPVAAPELSAERPAAPARRPALNMVVTSVLATGVGHVDEGTWSDVYDHQLALLVQFSNEPRLEGPNSTGAVKALLIYRDGARELMRMTGAWINQSGDSTEFRVDDMHRLIVGLMFGGELHAVGKRRVRVAVATDEIHTDVLALRGFETGSVTVRLTDFHRGEVLYEGEFQLKTHPPEIIRPRII